MTSTSKVEGSSSSNQQFWDDNAKRTIGPLLFAATQPPLTNQAGAPSHERHITQVGRWLQLGKISDPDVDAILRTADDRDAIDAFAGVKSAHEQRGRTSPPPRKVCWMRFAHPRTREALTPTGRDDCDFDAERILDEGGTLFVFAPEHEAEEFKPLFETIINTVVFAAQNRSARSGGLPHRAASLAARS